MGISTTNDTYRELYHKTQGPARYTNAPIGIQIVGRRLQEEKLLMIARSIEEAITLPHPPSAVDEDGFTYELGSRLDQRPDLKENTIHSINEMSTLSKV